MKKIIALITLIAFCACQKQSIDINDVEPVIALGNGGGEDELPTPVPDGYGQIVVYFNQAAADSFAVFPDLNTLNFLANDVLVGVRDVSQYDSTSNCSAPGNGVVITTFFNLWHPDSIEIVVIDNGRDTVWKSTQWSIVDSCIIVELRLDGMYLQ